MKYQKGTFILVPNKEVLRGKDAGLQSLFMWICDYANKNGQCFPSIKKLMNDTGIKSKTTLHKKLDELCDLGLITKKNRISGNEKLTNLYQVNLVEYKGNLEDVIPNDGASSKSEHPCPKSAPPIVQKMAIELNPRELNPPKSKLYRLCGKRVSAKHNSFSSEKTFYINTVRDKFSHSKNNPIIKFTVSTAEVEELAKRTIDELFIQINPMAGTLKDNPSQMKALLDMFSSPQIGIDDTCKALEVLIRFKDDVENGWEHSVKYAEELNTPQRLSHRFTALKRYIRELSENEDYQVWRDSSVYDPDELSEKDDEKIVVEPKVCPA